MELSGQYRITAPRDRVWAALNDPEILKASIPGCKSLEKQSDTDLAAKVAVKIGPVKATMSGTVKLSNIHAPNGYTITGEGRGAAAGFAKGVADVTLTEEGDETVLSYSARGQVGGKIAQLGARLIDSVARDMADKFFKAFAEKVGEGPLARAEQAVEHAVGDAAHRVTEAAHDVEEATEKAAARGFLGGPIMWALLALIALVLLIWLST